MPPRKRTDTTPEEPAVTTDEVPAGADTPDTPEKSDLQAVENPCGACFPNGWPAQGYAVGCEHGTWTRDQL